MLLVLAAARRPEAREEAPPPPSGRVESLEGPEGKRLAGRLAGDAATGFRFEPEGGGPARPLEAGDALGVEGPETASASATPAFRVELGAGQRISGRLGAIDAAAVALEEGPGRKPATVARAGALALQQRPGEALVFQEGFESLDPARWSAVGEPAIVAEPRLAGAHALRLPAGGAALTCRLAEPVGSGRLELAFFDDSRVTPGQRWFVDLTFRGPTGDEWVRALLGWDEETLAVQSSPGGPALPVQRLTRKEGWHRLIVRFSPERIDLTVDAYELAHGHGPAGSLLEVRLASQELGQAAVPRGLAGVIDDLRLARVAEPIGGLESDPSQDEVRLVGGDQLFGRLVRADAERVTLTVIDQEATFSWAEVSGLYFRRAPAPARPIEGTWVRAEWRAAPGGDPKDLDQAEGALTAATPEALTLATPYAGSLTIPHDRLKRLKVLGKMRRLVIDPTAHHLGNEVVRDLDPPQPEGRSLALKFPLDAVPDGPAALAVDVVQVAGEADMLPFSSFVKEGELRTNVRINGKPVDYLNRQVTSKNEAPERIRLAIPAGVLVAGENRVEFEEVGKKADPNDLDDLGILGVALESGFAGRAEAPAPGTPRP